MLSYFLYPFSLIYQLLFYFDKKLKTKYFLKNDIVISVGNITLGGTGKTPFTIELAKNIHSLYPKHEIYVLSRGYKGTKSKIGMVVEKNSNSKECGDEPLLIKSNLDYVNVLIGKNRFNTYNRFSKKVDLPNIIILDDGFQHHALHRNYDFVLIDSDFGIGNGFTIPAGYLRENIQSLKRASAIVFTKLNQSNKQKVEDLKNIISILNPKIKYFYMEYKTNVILNFYNKSIDIKAIKDKSILAFSGLGNPKSFYRLLEDLKPKELFKLNFIDHYDYKLNDLLMMGKKNTDYIICTEKDYVKLIQFKDIFDLSKIYYLKIDSIIYPEIDFRKNINFFIESIITRN